MISGAAADGSRGRSLATSWANQGIGEISHKNMTISNFWSEASRNREFKRKMQGGCCVLCCPFWSRLASGRVCLRGGGQVEVFRVASFPRSRVPQSSLNGPTSKENYDTIAYFFQGHILHQVCSLSSLPMEQLPCGIPFWQSNRNPKFSSHGVFV